MEPLDEDEAIDLKKLRYVLYVRQSIEDKKRQIRSLPDQIKDCREFARRNKLNIIGEPLEERKSAKRAGQRVVFDQMLLDIKAKKYDAILAWSPDRLSRNMLGGGLLINMIDEDELKDVRFTTHHFTNDASGKLTLGIMFSISKHFSDDLSRKITRGVKGNFREGKSSGSPKHGYDRDEVSGLYMPNDYFELIQQAWDKRVQGESVSSITSFLLEEGYHRVTKDKKEKRVIKPSINAINKMFHDSFYYGILVQVNQTVDLRTIYDFDAMIDEDTFNHVQVLGYGRTKDKHDKKRVEFKPLRGMVFCAVCNSTKYMGPGKNLPGGSTEHVLTYRCDNKACKREVKSFRAKHVFNSIYSMLEDFELTDEAYERYSKQIDYYTDDRILAIKEKVMSKRGALAHIKKELKDRALSITGHDRTSIIYRTNEEHIEGLAIQQADLEEEIQTLEDKVVDPNKIKLNKDEFLNLLKTASAKMKAGSAIEKDALCRILFLNLKVDNEKVASYIWREPFASLVKATELSLGVYVQRSSNPFYSKKLKRAAPRFASLRVNEAKC